MKTEVNKNFPFRFVNNLSLTNFFSSSTSNIDVTHDLGYKNHYKNEETTKILNVVNKYPPSEMKSFNISQSRINKLIQQRDRNGAYKNVEDLLELDGFGVKVLEKFCNSILERDLMNINNQEMNTLQDHQNLNKKHSFVTPILLENVRKSIKSIVALQVDLNYFAWTKISYNPQADGVNILKFHVEDWNCHQIGNSDKKLNLSELIQILTHLNEQIPSADVYVMEAMQTFTAMRSGQSQIVINVKKAQFYAMVSALMAARKSLILECNGKPDTIDTVYFLKNYLPSRLYKYLVGTERIASAEVIEKFFDYQFDYNHTINHKFESIYLSPDHRNYWKRSRDIEKEYLGTSFLTGLTFLKLSVDKCKHCIASLNLR